MERLDRDECLKLMERHPGWANGSEGCNSFGTHDWILKKAVKAAGAEGSWIRMRVALRATDDPDCKDGIDHASGTWWHVYDRWGDEWGGADEATAVWFPEVSFRAMAGHSIEFPKKSWNGMLLRHRLLEANGILLPDKLSDGGLAPADDVLDAAAAAWTAGRIAEEKARCLPDPPEKHPADVRLLSGTDSSGLRAVGWSPRICSRRDLGFSQRSG